MAQAVAPRYAVTQSPTPVFNTPEIAACFGGQDGNSLPLDDKGLMRTVETILFPHSKVQLLEQVAHTHIWKINAQDYPYTGSFYIDDRFVLQVLNNPPNRLIEAPSMGKIIKRLTEMEHCPYIWGGNWPAGIDLLAQLYPSRSPLNQLDQLVQNTWKLKGVDCSGLLHYVTDGMTPRNTSSLIKYGDAVKIEGKSIDGIIDSIQDLDIIVWKGHVIEVLSQHWTIESKHPEGLVRTKLYDRLSEIMKERKPVDTWKDSGHFVVRRWHPDNLS